MFFFPFVGFASYDIIDDYEVYDIQKPLTIPITPKKEANINSDKTMFLTFDDGPLLGSNNIISVLQEENVKATMFMIGKHAQRSKYRKKTFKRAIKEPLILVANHTYSHADGRYKHFYSDKEALIEDINKMDQILMENDPNHNLPYCRLAGRNVWRLPKIIRNDAGIPKRYCENDKYDALSECGYKIFGWDYQWEYNPRSGKVYKTPQEIANTIEKIYKRGRTRKTGKFVLLMHDFSFRDKFGGKEQLRELITELKSLGWGFATVANYIKAKNCKIPYAYNTRQQKTTEH